MGELFIDPWNLDPWQIGERFDVQKFIEDATSGKYDGPGPGFLNRKDLWYRQLKSDVESGIYDEGRFADEEEVFMQWLDMMCLFDCGFCDEPEEDRCRLFAASNDWILKAISIAGFAPSGVWANDYLIAERFIRYPELGWRWK